MRCSALPLASKCRGSWLLTQGYGSEQSRVGQAFHEAAKAKVLNQEFDLESLRTRYALTDAELKSVDSGVYNITIQIPKDALVLADNKQLTGLGGKLTGTPDLGIFANRILTVVDWKSGWGDVEDPETNNQVLGYGDLIFEALEAMGITEVDRIQLMIVQPRLNQIKSYVLTVDQLRARARDLERIIDEAEKGEREYTTGPWCTSCFKNMNCPAFAGQVVTLASFIEPGENVLVPDVERALRILLPVSKACATVSKKIDALAKAWVDKNGPLDLGAGQIYAKILDTKLELDAKKTLETLKEYFDEDSAWTVLAASMVKIQEMARKKKRGLSTIVKNRLIETGAAEKRPSIKYTIIKGGDRGEEAGAETSNNGAGGDWG